jgi:hypothetical protein
MRVGATDGSVPEPRKTEATTTLVRYAAMTTRTAAVKPLPIARISGARPRGSSRISRSVAVGAGVAGADVALAGAWSDAAGAWSDAARANA